MLHALRARGGLRRLGPGIEEVGQGPVRRASRRRFFATAGGPASHHAGLLPTRPAARPSPPSSSPSRSSRRSRCRLLPVVGAPSVCKPGEWHGHLLRRERHEPHRRHRRRAVERVRREGPPAAGGRQARGRRRHHDRRPRAARRLRARLPRLHVDDRAPARRPATACCSAPRWVATPARWRSGSPRTSSGTCSACSHRGGRACSLMSPRAFDTRCSPSVAVHSARPRSWPACPRRRTSKPPSASTAGA